MFKRSIVNSDRVSLVKNNLDVNSAWIKMYI